jgi:hypothetical protein
MYWKARIPLFLLTLGSMSGLAQWFPELFLAHAGYSIHSTFFLGVIGAIVMILEKTKINEKKIHFSLGISLILLGFVLDYTWV